jgi:release factor glutamine methyltransferase
VPDTAEATTVRDIVRDATNRLAGTGTNTPGLDAQLLACHAFGLTRVELATRDDMVPADDAIAAFDSYVDRRIAREPVQYITGIAYFRNLTVVVDPRALIPRPETELLVEWALERIGEGRAEPLRVLDLGTGSGAIATAIADEAPRGTVSVVATDVSAEALEVARRTVDDADVGDVVELLEGDLLDPVAGRMFDVIVTNPPYVSTSAKSSMSPSVRDFEPDVALYVDADDKLYFVRRILAEAPALLAPGGLLAMEIGAGAEDEVTAAFVAAGFTDMEERRDLRGIVRMVGGTRPA